MFCNLDGLHTYELKRIGFTFLMIKLGGLEDMKVAKLMLMLFIGVGILHHLHIGYAKT